ncbi:MAG: efflux RND transporter permease subunit [Planctomycetes bacterium]|nr:efflux RND transporter permease subunit [Planctomycetota bacterium]
MIKLASRARPFLGAIVLTTLLLVAGGIYCATLMPSAIYPEVTFPRIAVVARTPGLAVANMEVQVTRPLEQAVTTVSGVAQVRSKTIRGGSELSIDFTPQTDMLRAEQFTWNRIAAVRSQLPKDTDITLDRMTPSINPIMAVVLTGGENASRLRDYAYFQLAPQIKNVPDVLYANVAGGDVREIEVEPRPDDLLAAGLSAADVADQLAKIHILEPVGRVERPPFAFEIIVNTQGPSISQIENLVLATKNNQPWRLKDVADVKIGHEDRTLSVGYAGKDAVVINVFRSVGGNTVSVSRNVRALLEQHPPPGSIQARVVYDQADFVNTAVKNVRDAIVIGGFFSVLILLLFLRSWRATLISALAIPTTLAITFLLLYWTGGTLNLMSLGGLAVAIGLIIDDTVVVMENIARHLTPAKESRPGQEPRSEGTKDPVDAASGEITGAVIGSTLTTVLVFVPLAFIVGVYGQFFASLSWALSIAVLVSMVISLTLVPVFAARFLAGRPMPPPGPIYRFLAHLYELGLEVALRFPRITLALSLAAVGVGVLLYTGIPSFQGPGPKGEPPEPLVRGLQTGLMPAMDEGAFIFDYTAPSGAPLQEAEDMARKVEDKLAENPDVDSWVRRTGNENGLFATQTNRGDIQVVLRPAEDDIVSLLRKPVRPPLEKIEDEMKELGQQNATQKYGPHPTEEQVQQEGKAAIQRKYRRRSAEEVMDEVRDEVKEMYSEHQLRIDLTQIMQDELNDLSGANKPVEIKLFGPEYAQLRALAEKVGDTMEKNPHPGIEDINTNVMKGNPDLMINVDGVRARKAGLTDDEIRRQLETMYLGQVATEARESAMRITEVRVRYPNRLRFGPEQFDPDRVLNQWLLVPEPAQASGTTPPPSFNPVAGLSRAVPLYAVARLDRVRTPDEQWRENQQPALFVTTELNEQEAGLGQVVANIRSWMADLAKKGQIPPGYRWEIGGHYLHQQDAFRSLFLIMLVAIFLVYIMLAFQFRSVLLPLVIFLTQPLSLVSGLFALWLTHTPLNVSSYMGAILLIGLDMKNGILLVEYIQHLRSEGQPLHHALVEAGRTRFRPILMTSLAAILGLFPLALGIGPGSQMQQPLAIMVIGGLTANMLFTRMVIPVGYQVLEQLKGTKELPAAKPAVP